jgi:type IV pilus assembly protein PilN
MYSLDVNFLKDRGLETTSKAATLTQKPKQPIAAKLPILAGAIAALLFPAATFGYLKKVEAQKAEAEKSIQDIEAEIASISQQNQQIEQIKTQVQQIKQENQALVGVFEKIRPWSAILKEVSDRTPPGVQIDSLTQSGSAESVQLAIAGTARSYNDINDFVLFLQRSPFFNGQKITLNGASVAPLSVEIANQDDLPENASIEIPQGVKYTINTELSNTPASKLIREIESKDSDGMVTRLKILEQKGAF